VPTTRRLLLPPLIVTALTVLALTGASPALATPAGDLPRAALGGDGERRADGPGRAAAALVDAWVRGDRVAARQVAATDAIVETLFAAPPPERPEPLKCRQAAGGSVCAHELAPARHDPTARAGDPAAPRRVTLRVEASAERSSAVTAVAFA
jgi:hypothetical protein